MKRILCTLLAALMLLSLVACGGNNSTGNSGGGTSNEGRELDDELVVAVASDMTSMDPHVGKEISAVVVTNNIFATLLAKDEDGNIVPYVAESWEEVDDTTIDFKIREYITFHSTNS